LDLLLPDPCHAETAMLSRGFFHFDAVFSCMGKRFADPCF
jgi:hypothetical protein